MTTDGGRAAAPRGAGADRADLYGRVAVLQVTDAVAGYVRVLVSGKDGPTVFDLRCLVREALVRWLREHSPAALPRTRVDVPYPDLFRKPGRLEQRRGDGTDGADGNRTNGNSTNGNRTDGGAAAGARTRVQPPDGDDARLFGGDPEAERRSRAFSETGETSKVSKVHNHTAR